MLGVGFFNSKSKINVRVLAPDRVEVDQAFFEQRIQEALGKHLNNRRRAAAELGISRMGLYKKLHKYGLM